MHQERRCIGESAMLMDSVQPLSMTVDDLIYMFICLHVNAMLMDSIQPLSRSPSLSRYVHLCVHCAGLAGGKGGGGPAGVEVRLTDTTSDSDERVWGSRARDGGDGDGQSSGTRKWGDLGATDALRW